MATTTKRRAPVRKAATPAAKTAQKPSVVLIANGTIALDTVVYHAGDVVRLSDAALRAELLATGLAYEAAQ